MIASMRAANSGARTTQEQWLSEVGAALKQAVRALVFDAGRRGVRPSAVPIFPVCIRGFG